MDNPRTMLVIVFVSFISGIGGALIYSHYQKNVGEAKTNNSTKIAIVSYSELRDALPVESRQDQNAINQLVQNVQNHTKNLKEKGYIVLSSEAVMGAPDEYYITK